jgi:hypothetical protein
MWCVAELDREYIARMEDVLEIYEKPLDVAEPVVCIDEKPVSLHDDVRPGVPVAPGVIAKQDNEYERCGTANVFCAVEPKAGMHFTWPTPNQAKAWNRRVNRDRVKINWKFDRKAARKKFGYKYSFKRSKT